MLLLGMVWGLWPNSVTFGLGRLLGKSFALSLRQPALFCQAVDDTAFMGFGSKYSDERRKGHDSVDQGADGIREMNSIGLDDQRTPELPAPTSDGDATHTLEVDGPSVAMAELGPIIVNADGTLRRIENWSKLTKAEQASTMRIVARRNKRRLEALKLLEEEEAARKEGRTKGDEEVTLEARGEEML
jgi:hypothetical protein